MELTVSDRRNDGYYAFMEGYIAVGEHVFRVCRMGLVRVPMSLVTKGLLQEVPAV